MKNTIASFLPSPQLFLAQVRDLGGLKSVLGVILGIVILFAFVAVVVLVIYASLKRADDPDKAKQSMITAGWVALGWTIVTIIFVASGLGSAVVDVVLK